MYQVPLDKANLATALKKFKREMTEKRKEVFKIINPRTLKYLEELPGHKGHKRSLVQLISANVDQRHLWATVVVCTIVVALRRYSFSSLVTWVFRAGLTLTVLAVTYTE